MIGKHSAVGLLPSHPSLKFELDTDVQSFEIIVSIPNRLNEVTSRKLKSFALYLSIIFIFQIITNISWNVLLNFFMTKSGQTVSSP